MTILNLKKTTVYIAKTSSKWVKIFTAAVLALGATWFIATAVENHKQQQIQLALVQVVQTEAYGQFGAEVHMLAQLIVSEIGGHPDEWGEVVESVFGRVDSDLFPDTLEGVVKQKGSRHWQFNGMGDLVPDLMVTEQGLASIVFAEEALRAYYAGTFEFALPGVHSFCVSEACENAAAYFSQFCMLAERDGHQYYGSCDTSVVAMVASPMIMSRPVRRPADLVSVTKPSFAPKTATRPVHRPGGHVELAAINNIIASIIDAN